MVKRPIKLQIPRGPGGLGPGEDMEGSCLSTKHCSAEMLGRGRANSRPQTSGAVSRARWGLPSTCANDTPNFMGLAGHPGGKEVVLWAVVATPRERKGIRVAGRQTCNLLSTWGFAERKSNPTVQGLCS